MNQQSAQGLAALGRGPDSMLVHMAPGEVKSLQQLAMAHGGSLTINPETGLPEAGFLSSLLPMLIGGGLSIASGGALTPLMSGLITGGGYGVATGSLKKGLMAGLGAYGGAGLGSALAGAGAQGLATAAIPTVDAGQAMAAGAGDATANLAANATIPTGAPGMFGNAAGNFSKAGAGISGLGSEAGRNAFMSEIGGGKGLMKAGLMAAAPMMDTTTKQPEMKTDKDMGQRYQFNAGPTTPTPAPDVPGSGNLNQDFGKEQRYFTPSYTPIDNDAAKKLYGFASGGPVEAMSNANAIGMNTGYPQSSIRTGVYTAPTQVPVSQNMVTGAQDAAVHPYTGEVQFAEGGTVGGYTYDPKTGLYTKPGGQGATTVAPTGGISDLSGVSGGSSTSYVGAPEKTTTAEFAAQSERNQKINDFLTDLTKLSPTNMVMSGLNTLFGTQAPAPESYAGTAATQQAVDNALNAMSGRQESQMNAGSDFGGSPASSTGISSDGQGGYGGTAGSNGPGDGTASDYAYGGLTALAQGGMSNLGSYSDGGRLLRGPGDGISDSIPAMIGKKQPARLADGEFVVPARIVSELGNGSTEAGARKLYAMMDRVQKARGKTVGKGKVAANSRASKYLPA